MKYAVIDQDGNVRNIIVWDGTTPLALDDGQTEVAIPPGVSTGPGCTYDGTTWSEPDNPQPEID